MAFHEIWSIIIPSVVGVLGVLSGIWVGQYLSDRKEKQKSIDEITKLKNLLNADFTLINRMNQQALENIPKLENFVYEITNIMSEITNVEKFIKYFADFRFAVYEFTYWDPIMAHGILIRLSEHDLRFITTSHKTISDTIKIQTEGFVKFAENLHNLAYGSNDIDAIKTINIKIGLKAHLYSMKRSYDSIQDSITHVKNNIPWIDLTVEPIQELRENGPKMKIDDKGTYTFE